MDEIQVLALQRLKTALETASWRVLPEDEFCRLVSASGVVFYSEDHRKQSIREMGVKLATVKFERYPQRRYLLPGAKSFELAYSLSPQRGYISHLTALAYHGLYEPQITDFILNEEQSPKPSSSKLTQSGIDTAFSRPQRTSNHIGTYKDWTFTKINGKHTKNAGVVEMQNENGAVRVTNIPRTLIDCIVRPVYGCDPISLIQAFRLTESIIAPEQLVLEIIELLSLIGHKYPYHQTVGFCMERAFPSLSESALRPLLDLVQDFDFYLTYEMESPLFSRRWRLYYPNELN